MNNKSFFRNKTYIIDAAGKPLGRLASQIVIILRGKNSIDFVPYKESENIVIVKNVDKVLLTGKKKESLSYFSHSGYPGGEKHQPLKSVFEKDPGEVLRRAVLGMLPANRLRSRIVKNLRFER